MEDLKAAEGVTGSEKGGPKKGSKTGPLTNLNFEVFKTTRRDFWVARRNARGHQGGKEGQTPPVLMMLQRIMHEIFA